MASKKTEKGDHKHIHKIEAGAGGLSDEKIAEAKWKQGSENDVYLGDPPEWWVALNREYNAYYHLPCKEVWENKLEVLDPKYKEPKCDNCGAVIENGLVMLLLLQRMKVYLPGSSPGGGDPSSASP